MAETLFQDPNTLATAPPVSELASAPSSSGLGLSPQDQALVSAPLQEPPGSASMSLPVSPRPSLRDLAREEFQSKSDMGKLGAALQEFGAGVNGQPSPLRLRVEEKRKEKLLQMEELKGSVSALEHGIKVAEGLEGDSRTNFLNQYAGELDKVQPGLGSTFKALGDKPSLLTQFTQYAPYLSAPMQMMLKTQPKEFLKFAGTAEGIKALEGAHDRAMLEGPTGAMKKGSMIVAHFQQLAPPEMVEKFNKDGRITVKEFRDLNEYLKATGSPAALSDGELHAAEKNGDVFWSSLGILSPKHEQEALAADAKRTEKLKPGQMTELPLGGKNFAKAAYDPDGTLFPNAEHNADGFAILGKGTKEGMQVNFPASTAETYRTIDGVKHRIVVNIGKNGEVRETDAGPAEPAPKEQSPLQKMIADALAGKKPAEKPLGPEPKQDAPKIVATDVAKRFNSDPAMKGMKLGGKTAKGFEVKDAKGTVVGYYD